MGRLRGSHRTSRLTPIVLGPQASPPADCDRNVSDHETGGDGFSRDRMLVASVAEV
jgi:hypothetical protein